MFDGWDAVRPGQRLRIGFGVDAATGDRVAVRATLPPELVGIRVPRGVSFDAATRTLRLTLRGDRFGAAEIRARVARSARIGTPLEVIGYVTGPDDPLPLDDRGVDRAVVARRAVRTFPRARSSVARTWRGFCTLRYDYTF